MTMTWCRRSAWTAVPALLALTLAGGCRSRPQAPQQPIPSRGGRSFRLLVDQPPTHFLQNDPRWGDTTIGGSEEPLASVGCTICSVAMALNRLGVAIDPPTLNSALKHHDGYTESGWLVWGAVRAASGNRARAQYHSRFDHDTLDRAVRERCLPVVKLYLPGRVPHWVLIVGKSDTEYIVRDPLDASRKPVPLSKLATQIHAVRCIEAQPPS